MIDRRKFFFATGAVLAGAAGVLTWVLGGKRATTPAPAGAPQAKGAAGSAEPPVFPERYREGMRALAARLYPDEPDFAGAEATNAMGYIESELRRPDMVNQRTLALRGAVVLDRLCHAKTGKVFAKAAPAEQDLVIEALLAGEGDGERFKGKDFAHLMMALTLEGALGDPIHGGNKDEAGWKSVAWVMQGPRPAKKVAP